MSLNVNLKLNLPARVNIYFDVTRCAVLVNVQQEVDIQL